MEREDILDLLANISKLLDIKGENIFKIRAYKNAIGVLGAYDGNLIKAIESKEILQLKGIGEAITKKLYEYITTGKLKYYEEIKKDIPDTILEMFKIEGLGGRRIRILYDRLDIMNIDDLEKAISENKLIGLPEFGKKLQESIKRAIEIYKRDLH